MHTSAIDWSSALDLQAAVRTLKHEAHGDWHADPWGWPEYDFVQKSHSEAIFDRLNSSESRRAALLEVPKDNWGSRPAVVLDIVDRISYQALVDNVSVRLIGDMPYEAYGWRLHPREPKRGEYLPNSHQWDFYRSHLSNCATRYEYALTTDITSFFASIPQDSIEGLVEDRTPRNAVRRALTSLLRAFYSIPDRSGLPQRSTASAILANAFMEPMDDALRSLSREFDYDGEVQLDPEAEAPRRRRSAARWMDDMWLFGTSRADMRSAQVEIQRVAFSHHIHINAAKTHVFEGEEVAENALEIEHSAVDDALLGNEPNSEPLESLVDRILQNPEGASRTSMKFAITRLMKQNSLYRSEDILMAAPQMPHVADWLGAFIARRCATEELSDWLTDYFASPWSKFDWATASLLLMLDGNATAISKHKDRLLRNCERVDTPLPLLAASLSLLLHVDRSATRAVIDGSIRSIDNPHNRRILALFGLEAGCRGSRVAKWLGQEPENRVTLLMLEKNGRQSLRRRNLQKPWQA